MINILDKIKQCNIVGRHTWKDQILYLGHSASYIEFRFKGTKLEVSLITDLYKDKDDKEDIYHAWLAVFINNNEEPVKRIELSSRQETFSVFESTSEQEISIRLMKYSESAFSKLGFQSILLEGELLSPPPRKTRRIEFIGDSITCGYGVEGESNSDLFTTEEENPMLAYACQTAKLLDADFQLVSWSGIGIITNYVDETVNEPFLDRWLMPALYEYADGELDRSLQKATYEVWDNKRYIPDLVVIYLGTNDASYTRGIKERQEHFANEYGKFLDQVRMRNQQAYILCVLGSMNQELCEIEQRQVLSKQENGDDKIKFLTLPLQEEKDGLGTHGHPTPITHQKVAKQIAYVVREWIDWN
ncbi:MAG TPA: GDSL family lipase [Lachnospiraceae bacterium]|uniref:SGNH/GDSL hydrolase family protein n=1 Tax=Anaerosporobacter sp. TaxID=1872529 RepID=UPI000ED4A1E1|nr:SGNH/GDSL hydrolase family protein [Anaerosporobacter sp.]HAB60386.1 GDSL family lipase [Lachnospiraceae bacterium]